MCTYWNKVSLTKSKSKKNKKIDSIGIGLASPKEIRRWGERRLPNGTLLGQVEKDHTVDYESLKPIEGGLFCERIFGPVEDFYCSCERRGEKNEKFCPNCEVEFTKSRVRRTRMGYIPLAVPVAHVWYLRGRPSYIANLIGKSRNAVDRLAYGETLCESFIGNTDNNFFKESDTDLIKSEQNDSLNLKKNITHSPTSQAVLHVLRNAITTCTVRSNEGGNGGIGALGSGIGSTASTQCSTYASPKVGSTALLHVLRNTFGALGSGVLRSISTASTQCSTANRRWYFSGYKDMSSTKTGMDSKFQESNIFPVKQVMKYGKCDIEFTNLIHNLSSFHSYGKQNWNLFSRQMGLMSSFSQKFVQTTTNEKSSLFCEFFKFKLQNFQNFSNFLTVSLSTCSRSPIKNKINKDFVKPRFTKPRISCFSTMNPRLKSGAATSFVQNPRSCHTQVDKIHKKALDFVSLSTKFMIKVDENRGWLTKPVTFSLRLSQRVFRRASVISLQNNNLSLSKKIYLSPLLTRPGLAFGYPFSHAWGYKGNRSVLLFIHKGNQTMLTFGGNGGTGALGSGVVRYAHLGLQRRWLAVLQAKKVRGTKVVQNKDGMWDTKIGNQNKKMGTVGKYNKFHTLPLFSTFVYKEWSHRFSFLEYFVWSARNDDVTLPFYIHQQKENISHATRKNSLSFIKNKIISCSSSFSATKLTKNFDSTRSTRATRVIQQSLGCEANKLGMLICDNHNTEMVGCTFFHPKKGFFASQRRFEESLTSFLRISSKRGVQMSKQLTSSPLPHITTTQPYFKPSDPPKNIDGINTCSSAVLMHTPFPKAPKALRSTCSSAVLPIFDVPRFASKNGIGGMKTDLNLPYIPFGGKEGKNQQNQLWGKIDDPQQFPRLAELLSFTGGTALRYLLSRFDLILLGKFVRYELKNLEFKVNSLLALKMLTYSQGLLLGKLAKRRSKQIRRLKLLELFQFQKSNPEWMILSVLPVLPPDLRPILRVNDNFVVASDLNRLYQTVLRRNNTIRERLDDPLPCPESGLFRQRSLQKAVDGLLENGKGGGTPLCASKRRPLVSLSHVLKGKKGLFRQHLLGKRVDYSGRSVIVVGPKLGLHECGLPKEMAMELFQPFLLHKLKVKGLASSNTVARQMIQQEDPVIWPILKQLVYEHPVLLNRAPTLHRLGIQAFQPRLVSGRAILLHPLVCNGFNADFDGDQMAVHVPLSFQARAEAWKIMWSKNNLLSPATGQPILMPSQDMVLGCYYLSVSVPRVLGFLTPFETTVEHQDTVTTTTPASPLFRCAPTISTNMPYLMRPVLMHTLAIPSLMVRTNEDLLLTIKDGITIFDVPRFASTYSNTITTCNIFGANGGTGGMRQQRLCFATPKGKEAHLASHEKWYTGQHARQHYLRNTTTFLETLRIVQRCVQGFDTFNIKNWPGRTNYKFRGFIGPRTTLTYGRSATAKLYPFLWKLNFFGYNERGRDAVSQLLFFPRKRFISFSFFTYVNLKRVPILGFTVPPRVVMVSNCYHFLLNNILFPELQRKSLFSTVVASPRVKHSMSANIPNIIKPLTVSQAFASHGTQDGNDGVAKHKYCIATFGMHKYCKHREVLQSPEENYVPKKEVPLNNNSNSNGITTNIFYLNKNKEHYFSNLEDSLVAYFQGRLQTHTPFWVRVASHTIKISKEKQPLIDKEHFSPSLVAVLPTPLPKAAKVVEMASFEERPKNSIIEHRLLPFIQPRYGSSERVCNILFQNFHVKNPKSHVIVESNDALESPLELRLSADGNLVKISPTFQNHYNYNATILDQCNEQSIRYMRTTAGRVVINKTLF